MRSPIPMDNRRLARSLHYTILFSFLVLFPMIDARRIILHTCRVRRYASAPVTRRSQINSNYIFPAPLHSLFASVHRRRVVAEMSMGRLRRAGRKRPRPGARARTPEEDK